MAKQQLPAAKDRRRLLADSRPALGEGGRSSLQAERWGEALECLKAAQDREALELLASSALEAGDFFYWTQALQALGREPGADELAELAQNARAAGKTAFADAAEKPQGSGEDQD